MAAAVCRLPGAASSRASARALLVTFSAPCAEFLAPPDPAKVRAAAAKAATATATASPPSRPPARPLAQIAAAPARAVPAAAAAVEPDARENGGDRAQRGSAPARPSVGEKLGADGLLDPAVIKRAKERREARLRKSAGAK